jgi:flagellar basal-body rod protein FlgF
MDKLIYTAFNTVNNIYDNRAVRAQNLANIAVPGYKRDLGSKSVGTAFLNNMETLQSRAMAVQDDNNYFSTEPGTVNQTGVDTDVAIRGDGYFIVQGLGDPSLSRRGDLRVSNDGFLENGTSQKVLNTTLQPINVPDYRFLTVSDDGNVIIEPLGSDPGTKQIIGRIALTQAPQGELKKYADGEIRLRDGTVPPLDDEIRVIAKHIELSNVNITEELINSIEDQRQYEINIKMIASAGELDEAGASLIRLPT